MKINFTKKQYETLVRMMYLGNFMANGIHTEKDRNADIDNLEQYIFSYAKEFGHEEYMDKDEMRGKIYPSRVLDEDETIQRAIDAYDEHCFWQELFYRMYERDFSRRYTLEEIKKMSMGQRFEREEPFREKYGNEFEEYGIERLEITERPKLDN